MAFRVYNDSYEPETATNFFDELAEAVKRRSDYQEVYSAMDMVFRKFLNQKTGDIPINFVGVFAKTDYLLKEYKAPRQLVMATNDTRVRLRRHATLSHDTLQKYCMHDLRNLCLFIALVYGADIPAQLTTLFPQEPLPTYAPVHVGEYLRAIVIRWDDEYVWVTTEYSHDGEPTKVCYAHSNRFFNYDWTYLKTLFYKDAQLNLIHPRENNGVVYPELIIFEPDYLVNISTVARCFTNYADSPFVDLINKLEPQQVSEALVLGNLAGQLLDEALRDATGTRPYSESAKEFFKNNAISLMMIQGGREFHQKAMLQKQHIHRAIHESLPKAVKSFDPERSITEPSFFSEMLGIQGRMDFLQLDYGILMEQKSGKGAFPYDNFVTPHHTEQHYVQMQLYMLLVRYNFEKIYKQNGNRLHAFLLYTKYQKSLLGLGFAPEVVFNAIRLRNRLAWTELWYTKPEGFRILERMTPQMLNMKHDRSKAWMDYQKPQIAAVLDPIGQASPVEKAYYFRFLTFIANEHAMSKLGNKIKDDAGFASTWHDSLEEKRQAGNIYDRLKLLPLTQTDDGKPMPVESVELGFAETDDNDMANFRKGDIVILYPYTEGEEPDARQTMVHRCTIETIGTGTIRLKLRTTQSNRHVFDDQKDKPWAIEHDFMESSYSSLYKGMQAFLMAPKERRDLLMLQRLPKVDETAVLKGDYGKFNELARRVKQARDMFLIIGPPGTGKTSYGLLNTVKEELLEPEASVLLLSYTNRAVDEICSKLKKEDIDFIRIGGPVSCAEEYQDKLIGRKVEESGSVTQLRETLTQARVVVGTTTALNSNIVLFQLKQFSLAVIDEASQILEPHLMGLLSACHNGKAAIRKFVMIGDHKQLPAVVQQQEEVSRVDDALLNGILLTDCRLSLFERLLKRYAKDKTVVYMLTHQGRMHHDIALFPNYSFYNNRLKVVPLCHQNRVLPLKGYGKNGIADLLQTRRIAFIDTELPEETPSDKVNTTEAEMIAATVVKIYEIERASDSFDVDRTVGVIVPYRNQITTIRKAIDGYGIPQLHDITIDTVERFQGSQRQYIIYGFTIQKYYQLKFLTSHVFEDETDNSIVDRKLNVAMTRAMEHLVMFGHAELLANNFTFFKLMEFVRSKHGLFRIGKDNYVKGTFDVPQYHAEELDLGKATFTVSQRFESAFRRHVIQPAKELSDDGWPTRVLGNDMATNLTSIGYGRVNFSTPLQMFGKQLTPERQVLIYCYYIMKQHYCSSRNIYESYREWIAAQAAEVNGRVQIIDIGSGPATSGIAFAEVFGSVAPRLAYTAIDVSAEMRNMGKRLLDDVFEGRLHHQSVSSFNDLGASFWEGCSKLPSLVVVNISYFFSNVNAAFTEKLALQLCEVMRKYPLNRYLFIIQHSECDRQLNAYRVFRRIMAPMTSAVRSEQATLSYVLSDKEHSLNFYYDIWENK